MVVVLIIRSPCCCTSELVFVIVSVKIKENCGNVKFFVSLSNFIKKKNRLFFSYTLKKNLIYNKLLTNINATKKKLCVKPSEKRINSHDEKRLRVLFDDSVICYCISFTIVYHKIHMNQIVYANC